MGIQGLLSFVGAALKTVSLKELGGKRVAIDGYAWLHLGVYACATQLYLKLPTRKYVDFIMGRLRRMQQMNITPVMVFDGAKLPSKSSTENSRQESRLEEGERGLKALLLGDYTKAYKHFQKAVDVTPEMAHEVISALSSSGIEYVVAPFEADAQLAYMNIKRQVDAIFTEDSDLLAFGSPVVYFKVDFQAGTARRAVLKDVLRLRTPDLTSFSEQMFREMCVLSGCDYLSSLEGVGLKTAYQLMKAWKSPVRAIKMLRLKSRKPVPYGYEKQFNRAIATFMHQYVFDVERQKVVHFRPVPKRYFEHIQMHLSEFLGSLQEPDVQNGICLGKIHPDTLEVFGSITSESLPPQDGQRFKLVAEFRRNPAKFQRLFTDRRSKYSRRTTSKRDANAQQQIQKFFTPVAHVSESKRARVRSPPSSAPTDTGPILTTANGKTTCAREDYVKLSTTVSRAPRSIKGCVAWGGEFRTFTRKPLSAAKPLPSDLQSSKFFAAPPAAPTITETTNTSPACELQSSPVPAGAATPSTPVADSAPSSPVLGAMRTPASSLTGQSPASASPEILLTPATAHDKPDVIEISDDDEVYVEDPYHSGRVGRKRSGKLALRRIEQFEETMSQFRLDFTPPPPSTEKGGDDSVVSTGALLHRKAISSSVFASGYRVQMPHAASSLLPDDPNGLMTPSRVNDAPSRRHRLRLASLESPRTVAAPGSLVRGAKKAAPRRVTGRVRSRPDVDSPDVDVDRSRKRPMHRLVTTVPAHDPPSVDSPVSIPSPSHHDRDTTGDDAPTKAVTGSLDLSAFVFVGKYDGFL